MNLYWNHLSLFDTGLWRLEPPDPCPGSEDDGVYQGGQDHRLPVPAAQELPEGRGPLRQENRRCLRGQASRHQRSAGGGSGLPRISPWHAVWFQPYGNETNF